MGDALLREVAARMIHAVRKTDTVARIGGDEFIVLLPDLHIPLEIEVIAAKIVSAISTPFLNGTREIPLSGSVGGCTYPSGGTDAERLLQCVDAAMYRAKGLGRSQYFVADQQSFPTQASR